MSSEENIHKEQDGEHRQRLQVAEISLGGVAVEVTATRVPVADFGPYKADHFQTFGGLGIDAYANFTK